MEQEPSSEPSWITISDGSDRDWRLISMYELRELEYAINEECIGKTDSCPPGHLKEMHDSGNEVIDKVRNRPRTCRSMDEKESTRGWVRRLVAKIATEIDPDVEVEIIPVSEHGRWREDENIEEIR